MNPSFKINLAFLEDIQPVQFHLVLCCLHQYQQFGHGEFFLKKYKQENMLKRGIYPKKSTICNIIREKNLKVIIVGKIIYINLK